MDNFEKRTNKKKKAIVDSALTLFGEQGFSNVSIKDIATLAGVSQVSIYNYFGSKEALVAECAKVIMEDTTRLARELLASNAPFIEKLEQALQLCNAEINESLNKFISEKALEDQSFIALMAKSINELKKTIYMEYIDYGKREKAIDSNLSDTSIQLFIDAINSLGMSVPAEDLQHAQKDIIQLFLYGLLGKPRDNR